MQITDRGLDLVKSFEGYHRRLPDGSCTAYRCPAGVLTIGWGCTEGVREGQVWTEAEAEAALRRELVRFESAVQRLVTVDINANERDALISFAYNCGEGALSKSSLLKLLNKGDREGAARSFAAWNKGGGKVLPGLVRRRAAEAALFLEAVDHTEPDMPQRVRPQEPTPPATVDATAGAVAAGGFALPHVPAPPDLSPYTAWQGFAETVAGMGSWIIGAPWKLALVGGAVALIGWGLPWISRRAQQ
ncbi:MAG: lysozyme [Alsobacter sp.]